MHLKPELLTLLVFGGSQGAQKINETVLELLPILHLKKLSFQLIQCTGDEKRVEQVIKLCSELEIPCYVKRFEPQMGICWSAADLVICRAGAMTLSELLHYEVPGILIPYPFAADHHQLKNASVLQEIVGGARVIEEHLLNAEKLAVAVLEGVGSAAQMKRGLNRYKTEQKSRV